MGILRVLRRFRALVRADPAGVRAGFVAHLLATGTGLVAGLILGSITGTLEALPGLLVLVPAAVGLRGNVYGALGSRLGTLVATGNFRLSRRRDTEVGQNLWASVGLSLALSLLLALVAKGVAEAFGVRNSISVADFAVISVLGGLIPTAVVMMITVGVAALGVRREWDVDNVAAPVVTAAGDMITLPCLFLATLLVTDVPSDVTSVLAIVSAGIGLGALAASLRSRLPVLRRIVRESVPILLAAGTLSTLAGVTIQSRLTPLVADPAILIVIPPLLSLSGSLAGMLSARISTKLHLGLVDPSRFAIAPVSADVTLVYVIGIPIFLVLGVAADALAVVAGLRSPGVLELIELLLLAGVLATTLAALVGYLGAIVTYRLGWDPDNNGIPMVSSASDFLGAISLMVSLAVLGLT
jgi:mgtE-like transporter